jgi:hypothetical protein
VQNAHLGNVAINFNIMRKLIFIMFITVMAVNVSFSQTDCLDYPMKDKANEKIHDALEDALNNMNNSFVANYSKIAKSKSKTEFRNYVIAREGFKADNKLAKDVIDDSYDNIVSFNKKNTEKLERTYAKYAYQVSKDVKSIDNLESNINGFWGVSAANSKRGSCKWYQLRCHFCKIFGCGAADEIIDILTDIIREILLP